MDNLYRSEPRSPLAEFLLEMVELRAEVMDLRAENIRLAAQVRALKRTQFECWSLPVGSSYAKAATPIPTIDEAAACISIRRMGAGDFDPYVVSFLP